jgi:hypothetical protein
MLRWLMSYLGLDDPYAEAKRGARLTQAEAQSIAKRASDRVSDAHDLGFVAIEHEGGERVWVFATNSRGSAWQVKVRDSDGNIMSRGRIGGR